MSGDARAVHLLPASELFRKGYRADTLVAVCGEVVTSPPNGAGADPGCCLECVSAAVRLSALGTRGEGSGDR